MSQNSLEALLRERLSNPRAMIGALSGSGEKIELTFGDIGDLPRIVLAFDGNRITRVTVTAPKGAESAEKSAGEGKGAISNPSAPDAPETEETKPAAKSDGN